MGYQRWSNLSIPRSHEHRRRTSSQEGCSSWATAMIQTTGPHSHEHPRKNGNQVSRECSLWISAMALTIGLGPTSIHARMAVRGLGMVVVSNRQWPRHVPRSHEHRRKCVNQGLGMVVVGHRQWPRHAPRSHEHRRKCVNQGLGMVVVSNRQWPRHAPRSHEHRRKCVSQVPRNGRGGYRRWPAIGPFDFTNIDVRKAVEGRECFSMVLSIEQTGLYL